MSLRGAQATKQSRWPNWIASLTLTMTLCLGCGSGTIVELTNNTPTTNNTEGPSLNLAPSEKIYVAAAFFTDPVGSIATIGMNNPHPVQDKLAITDSSDVVIRSFDNKLFVINRGVTSTIQVIDPDTFKIVGNYSVEPSSNPHDLVVANGKAFISRYDANRASDNKDDLWVVEPLTGRLITSIDLKPYTTDDGNRLARASLMTSVGDLLYVLIQDLSSTFAATTVGKVAVVNTRTNSLVDVDSTAAGIQVITLQGRNPTSIAYSEPLNQLWITETGVFRNDFTTDVTTPYGGLEVINAATHQTLGILIDDQALGGYLFSVVLANKNLGFVTVKAETVATFDPEKATVLNPSLYTTRSGFMPEILLDRNGMLWIPERDPRNDGMVILSPESGTLIAGPLAVGALPASMALLR